VTRLKRWPSTPLVEPETLDDFTETLANELEDTVRNLKVLGDRNVATVESRNYQMQAITLLTDELREQRRDLGRVIETLGTKASKGALQKLEGALTAKIDKRVDNLHKLAGLAITMIGLFIAWKVK
jgi:hypothetical protein